MANTFAKRVAAIADQNGVESLSGVKVGFHDFRGTFAERSLIAGINVGISRGLDKNKAEAAALRATQKLLGHRRIESTERYLKFREHKQVLLSANESYGRSLLRETKK
jgi:integrase